MKTYKRQCAAIVLALLLASMSVAALAAEPSPETESSEISSTPQSQSENSAADSTPQQEHVPETPTQNSLPETPTPQQNSIAEVSAQLPAQDSAPETPTQLPTQDSAPETPTQPLPQKPAPEAPTQLPPQTSAVNKDEAEAEREKREAARERREAEREREENKKEQREAKREAEREKKAENTAVPILQITKGTLPDNIGAEQKFMLPLTIKNLSSTENIENLTLNFSTSEALLLLDASSLKVFKSLAAGQSIDLALEMQTTKEITSAAQFVTAELKYDYLPASAGIRKNNSATEKILVPLTPTEEKKKFQSATPNLIISKYDYGSEPIPVGSVFNLKLVFCNTSQKLPVENIVMQLETGEAFSITASSNAFFFPNLGVGGEKEQDIQVQALASAKPETNKITVTFNYEFVDQDTREKTNVSEKLAIPIIQPDRFEVTPPQLPEKVTVGEETVLTFQYVNKGRSELYNVEASLEGDASTLNPRQNLGNFEAGKSGTINFLVTPQEIGEITFTAKILYEDANLNQKEIKLPVKLTIGEPEPEFSFADEMESMDSEENTPNKWILGVLAGLVTVPVALVGLIRKFKKRRLRKAAENAAREESGLADEAKLNWEEGEDDYAEK